MATKTKITSVTFTLTNGNEVTITTPIAYRAWENFLSGRPIEDNDGNVYSPSAVLVAVPTKEDESVDMTDTSCTSGGGDVLFYLPLTETTGVNVTSDMITCAEVEGVYFAYVIVPNTTLVVGINYRMGSVCDAVFESDYGTEWNSDDFTMRNHDTFGDGRSEDLFIEFDSERAVGATCEEARAGLANLLANVSIEIVDFCGK